MGGLTRTPPAPQKMQGSYQPAVMPQMPPRLMMPVREGGPTMAPSMYGPQQGGGMSSMIAALRANAPQGQMNPGVQFMQNQPNAPAMPMTSYLRGQEMMQAQQPQPQAPSEVTKDIFGNYKGQPPRSNAKGMMGPVPKTSIAPQRPPVQQATAPKTLNQIMNATASEPTNGLIAAVARQRAMQQQNAAQSPSPVVAPVQQPMTQAQMMPMPVAPRAVPIAPPPTVAKRQIANPLAKKNLRFQNLE